MQQCLDALRKGRLPRSISCFADEFAIHVHLAIVSQIAGRDNQRVLVLKLLVVPQTLQGLGFGTWILTQLEAVARARKCTFLCVCHVSNDYMYRIVQKRQFGGTSMFAFKLLNST